MRCNVYIESKVQLIPAITIMKLPEALHTQEYFYTLHKFILLSHNLNHKTNIITNHLTNSNIRALFGPFHSSKSWLAHSYSASIYPDNFDKVRPLQNLCSWCKTNCACCQCFCNTILENHLFFQNSFHWSATDFASDCTRNTSIKCYFLYRLIRMVNPLYIQNHHPTLSTNLPYYLDEVHINYYTLNDK